MSDQPEQEYNRRQQKEIDELNWRLAFQKQAAADMNANEGISEFLKQYNEKSIQQFKDFYISQKTRWYEHGDLYLRLKEKHELKWIEAGWWHLRLIQQKKLFDLQCLWRAEQIELPGIELCCDFGYWEADILNCPFLDPITPDEAELYQLYLQGGDAELEEDIPFASSWQYYAPIKEAYNTNNEEGRLPAWYEFYNDHKGTAIHLSLPDIRGEKEAFYIRLARDANPAKRETLQRMQQVFDQPPGAPIIDKDGREYVNYHDPSFMASFVETFENKTTNEYYKAAEWFFSNNDDGGEERTQELIDFLLSTNEPIAIEAHDDWKEAIRIAVRNYTIHKIAEALPEAFEQYRLTTSFNISFPAGKTEHMAAAKKSRKEDILKGRELNGEPPDLNF